jgi:hypothetical protein
MKNRKHKQYNRAERIIIKSLDKQQVSKEQKEPPAPGFFVGYSYNCGHTIHEVYHDLAGQQKPRSEAERVQQFS